MIETGTFLQNRYRIDRQIGQGGMGAVYVATDERFNSTVAIKETLCMDDSFRKAIEREARLLNSLKHAALPRVSDHFEENAVQFLVMEYIQGEDLHAILERDKQAFPVDTVLMWADQLLEALEYLHTQTDPVIHRDIKPQNLKVTSRGQIVLLDFGLAKGNATDAGINTAAKSIFGYSRNYASLEQIQGTGTDPRSDLYSLAATLYHLLTNTPPDDALTRAMSVLAHKGDPLRPANQVNPSVPAGVAGVLQQALALNASDRPSSAAEMRSMLKDSGPYEYMAEPNRFAAGTPDPHIYAQPTRLMPDETQAESIVDTDVKTVVLPGQMSHPTATQVTDAEHSSTAGAIFVPAGRVRRRRLGLWAALVTVLVALGAVAGVVQLSGMFGHSSQTPFESEKPEPVDQVTVPATNANAAEVPSAETRANAEQPEPTRQPGSSKTSETAAKNGKTSAPPDAPDETDPDSIDVQEDEDGSPGSVIITRRDKNGKVTTTRVDPNVQPPNVPAFPRDFNPFPPGFDPGKQMTPAEREQLKRLMRERIRQQVNAAQHPPQ